MQKRKLRFSLLVLCFCALLSVFWQKAYAGYITPQEPGFTSNRNGTVPPVWTEVKGDQYSWASKATDVGKQQCFTCHPFKQDEPGLTPAEWDMDVHVKVKGTFECESCHGPGSMHVDANSPEYIVNPTDLPKPLQNQMCQACHLQGMVAIHAGANLSCLDCHQFHTVKNPKDLKKLPERELCYSCHAGVRAEFNMYDHHPVNEGIMTCTDCHEPHFSSSLNDLKGEFSVLGSRQSMEPCGTCHPREAGPYVSSPTALEGCTGCHMPHGSMVGNLERMPEPALCLKCHSVTSHQFAELPTLCTQCHLNIHGSNHVRMLFY
jgi:DmsE family decaheme c-type cytochrome